MVAMGKQCMISSTASMFSSLWRKRQNLSLTCYGNEEPSSSFNNHRATSEDYKLLENMNKLTSLKYLEMKDIAINISRNLKDLNQKYADLQPYLEQINLIEEQVAALEQAAYKLDAYSKKLEAKYKKLEKR
ncbi:biogenesis of lysosome-related organelles complex 1 subunit 2-like [Pseudopipra pipra]|uniref:biogenesis of lysosome-related organelles complex 1 subunit 2-like n=1 Tax=Pseudopipra pipra TaxID=415032 RepID=UPI00313A37C0